MQTDVLVNGLQSEISSLNSAIGNLNAQISSPSGASTPGNDDESDHQSGQSAQRESVTGVPAPGAGSAAQLNEQSANDVSHVLDPAAVTAASKKKVELEDALLGLVVGLAVGFGAVIFGALLADRCSTARPWRNVGRPSGAEPRRYPSTRHAQESDAQTTPRAELSLRMIERRLRGHLESAPDRHWRS